MTLNGLTPAVLAQETIPSFSLPDLSGQKQAMSQWKGKTLVINFWATWCQSCLKEMSDFIQLQAQYAKQNVQFIGIAIDEIAPVTAFTARLGVNYPTLVASEWEGFNLSQQFGNTANIVPYTVVINPDEKVIFSYAGAVKKDDLVAAINKATLKSH